MVRKISIRFAADESGAVTVDWVVLTAAVIALVFSVFTIITQQSVEVGATIVSDNLVEASEYRPVFGSGGS